MGKNKNKKHQTSTPNAPDFQQVYLASSVGHQPPVNPYYQSAQDPILTQQQSYAPPPPYNTDHQQPPSAYPMSRLNSTTNSHYPTSGPNYSRLNAAGQPAVIIHQQPAAVYYDRKAERRHRQVRSFNNQIFLLALATIVLSMYAGSLFDKRSFCTGAFGSLVVYKGPNNVIVNIKDVQDLHIRIAGLGVVLLILSLVKCIVGQSKSYSCFLFLMALLTLMGTLMTGALAYLAFYSPCTANLGELALKALKTGFAHLTDNQTLSPDKQLFGELNVIQTRQEDPQGLYIFCIDIFNFAMYFSAFISAISLC